MKIPENVKELISNYMAYLQESTESEKDAIKAMEPITVVRRIDDIMFHVIGVTTDPNTNGAIIDLKSNVPFVESHDGVTAERIQYKYCTVSGNEFDEHFMLFSDWQQGLFNLMVAEMNKEIFKFLHPYFISSEKDWSFEIDHKGSVMSIIFRGYGSYKCEKLVIRLWKINKADITLYRDGRDGYICNTVFDYDDTAVTMDPIQCGPLTNKDMIKLCEKVEEIMRRNMI